MEVRVTYRSEIYLEGDSLEEIKRKFEDINLDPIGKDDESVTDYGYVELVSVEDANTYADLEKEWNKL